MKLFLICFLSTVIYSTSGSSDYDDDYDADTENKPESDGFLATNVVYGSDTPVYYLDLIRTDYVKVNRETNKFSNGNSPDFVYSNSLFPKLLIVVDYDMYKKYGDTGLIRRVEGLMPTINSLQTVASTPSIKYHLAGLVLPTNSSIFGLPEPNDASFEEFFMDESELAMSKENFERDNFVQIDKYVVAKPTLKKVSEWLVSNKNKFESLKYDVLMFLSSWLISDEKPGKTASIINSYTTGKICPEGTNDQPGVILPESLGSSSFVYPIALSYIFGLSHPQDKADSQYFTKTQHMSIAHFMEWASQFPSTVSQKFQSGTYSCLRK